MYAHQYQMDPDNWFSELYYIDQKLKKIKSEYEKDEDSIKVHVISNLPDDYKGVRTSLYMNASYTYKDYKKFKRHFWYSGLGGKEMIANGSDITYKAGGSTGTVDQEHALNTSTGGFRGRCSKGGQVGHKRMFAGMTICQEIVEKIGRAHV